MEPLLNRTAVDLIRPSMELDPGSIVTMRAWITGSSPVMTT